MTKLGAFISFEGGDGAGKSTQINRLADVLRSEGQEVVVTREPGGTEGGEAVRAILVRGEADRWSPLTEALLMYAARADHLEKTILPAIARGAIVITDRFADSSMAYQGIAGALGEETINSLNALVVGAHAPDLTIILDVTAEMGLERATSNGGETRFEKKGVAYQQRVMAAFLKIARDNPNRCVVVDASGLKDDVGANVLVAVKHKLPGLLPTLSGA